MKKNFLDGTYPKGFNEKTIENEQIEIRPNTAQIVPSLLSQNDNKNEVFFVFKKALNGTIIKGKRIWELDFLRGLCIILMIFDHFFFLASGPFSDALSLTPSGNNFINFAKFYWYDSPRDIIHIIVLFFFFALCGISCYLSRSNFKRGLLLAIVATLYSTLSSILNTTLEMREVLVNYGVLNFLATCILFYSIIEFLCKKNKIALSVISGILAFTVWILFCLYTPPKNLPIELSWLFPTKNFSGLNMFTYKCYSSFTQYEISPADFFPLIPYATFFFFGTLMGYALYDKKQSLLKKLDGKWNKFVCLMGRHTLIIYVAHIVLLALLLEIITYFSTGSPFLFDF